MRKKQKRNPNWRPFSQKEKDIVRENITTQSFSKIALQVGRKKRSIISHILRTKEYDIMNLPNLYDVNHFQFSENFTKESSYLLGFIWADGSIDIKYGTVTIEIVENDAINLKPIFDKTGDWVFKNPKREKAGQTVTRIRTFNRVLVNFLENYDFGVHIKNLVSPYKILELIPEEFHHYFFRGWFDGDGSILKDGSCTAIHSSIEQDWGAIKELSKKLRFYYKVKRHRCSKGGRSMLEMYSAQNQTRFLNYIYEGRVVDGIGLCRKYEIYKSIMKIFSERDIGKVKYRGVQNHRTNPNKFVSKIRIDGPQKEIGIFDSMEEAAKAYDKANVLKNGECANTNFPIENYLHLIKT